MIIFEKLSSIDYRMDINAKTVSSQPLLDYFNKLIPLSQEEQELVRSKFHPHLFLKKQFALQHGDVCEYFDLILLVFTKK